jgi:phosphoribosylglycinamide formyltransferase 1
VRLGVLASGTGSVLQAILDAELPVSLVITDRRCGAIEVAENAGVPVEVIERTDFSKAFDRDGYTKLVVEALKHHDIELVAMAGFGTIIPAIWDSYPDRVLNTHPALLPAFKGWHPVRDTLAYGVKVTGCTVHFATPEMDAGPILAQEAVPVLPDDTEETLHERIKQVERRLYPATIRKVMES